MIAGLSSNANGEGVEMLNRKEMISMSIEKGEILFDCRKCVNWYSRDRKSACAPCGEEYNGQTLSVYCRVGCGHCVYGNDCPSYRLGRQNICDRFILDHDLDT